MNIDNPKIWTLTDGSKGMISQALGLAIQLSKNITEIKTDLIFPWNKLQPGFLPSFNWIFKNQLPKEIPDIIISCGRRSVYLSTYLKKKYSNIINIHIQNPKVSSNKFSFIVAPNHDNYRGKNVINSTGALHNFNNYINSEKTLIDGSNNLVSCMIGGENNHYIFDKAYKLCNKIKQLKKIINLNFLIISSRRTNAKIKSVIKDELNLISELWLGEGNNPYKFALYNSKYFIITSDSTSMISEASISGRPIYIYQLPFKRKSIRFERFHSEFNQLNITRDFEVTDNLNEWSYPKLDESKRIAGIIKERIIDGINESR